mmetsp:Transcript_11277/g.28271  ORF Transcript_11277/g.28271 Transcript_11277/m.28271 type:complete len:713 (+) Transcript_11277:1-2139(+)
MSSALAAQIYFIYKAYTLPGPDPYQRCASATCSSVILGFCFAFGFLRTSTSKLTRQSECVLFLLWLDSAVDLVDVSGSGCPSAWSVLNVCADALQPLAFFWALYGRMTLIEEAFGSVLGAKYLQIPWGFVSICKVCEITVVLLPSAYKPDVLRQLGLRCFLPLAISVSYALTAVITGFVLASLFQKASPPGKHLSSFLQSEAKWARLVILRTAAGMMLPLCVSVLHWAWQAYTANVDEELPHCRIHYTSGNLAFWHDARLFLFALTEFLSLIVMCGVCEPLRPMERVSRKMFPRLTRNQSIQSCASVSTSASRSQPWQKTVRTLANRSISAMELLQFYDSLGTAGNSMPHFDPARHTTNDVVRQAIIPMTHVGQHGLAYATLLAARESPMGNMEGSTVHEERAESCSGKDWSDDQIDAERCTSGCTIGSSCSNRMPHVMVTHTWAGQFLHLVAAVCAEALGLDEYEGIARELAKGGATEDLASRLRTCGTGDRLYWICAFCVNQHSCICGGFGSPPPSGTPEHERWEKGCRDTVTGEAFSICTCQEEKWMSQDAPDECEINKFDDVMDVLQQEMPGLCQLAALDSKFDIFSRVWCMAEFVQAYLSGIPQKVCIYSNQLLAVDNDDLSLYVKLATLTVTECNASRPEDKVSILAKIPDVQEFDAQLQAVIMGKRGLLSRHLEGFDVIYGAACSVRRVKVAKDQLAKRSTMDWP